MTSRAQPTSYISVMSLAVLGSMGRMVLTEIVRHVCEGTCETRNPHPSESVVYILRKGGRLYMS